jgi:replicative DNA helicase Mcm
MSEIQYTREAKIDRITEFIQSDSNYSDILNSLKGKPGTTIRFNPLENQSMSDLFLESPEEFPELVKCAFVMASFDKKTRESVAKFTKVEISDATSILMSEWSAEHEGIPMAVECQVIGTNRMETYTKFAEAFCSVCMNREPINSLGHIPTCPDNECSGRHKQMTVIPNSVKTGPFKIIMIQEPIEQAKHGMPANFDCIVKDEYATQTYIGQRVKLIGVFRSYPQKGKYTNKILINTISMKNLDEVQEIQPTDEQKQFFKSLRAQPNFLDVVTESIAPEIKHEWLAKFCILLALIGSPAGERIRDMIHALLVGDPGSGKSAILAYILLLIKKSGFAVGGTMSGSGVTVTMDTLPNRQKMPRAGIIPLCDGGVVALDEGNQLEEEDLGKIYECMETGMIHYNKGGWDLPLHAKTTICMGVNPKYYIYNNQHSIVDNINLPGPLLSRFDTITNMERKKKSDIQRQEIIDHINLVDQIGFREYIRQAKLLQPEDLAAFISDCKTYNPVFTDESNAIAKDFQMKMEKIEQDDGVLPIDNRFYYSIKRLSKAVARLYGSHVVEPEHVRMAIDTKKKCMLTFGMNVEAGELQMKMSSDSKDGRSAFFAVCNGLQRRNVDGRFSEDECIKAMHLQYPEYFNNIEQASRMFGKMTDCLDKLAGRYKLS